MLSSQIRISSIKKFKEGRPRPANDIVHIDSNTLRQLIDNKI